MIADDQVIIGLYCELTGSACTHVDIHEFVDLNTFLYDPQWFRLLTHGIKRIWKELEIGTLDTHTHLIADTEMMAYFLDSGRDEHEYTLSYLAHRHLEVN